MGRHLDKCLERKSFAGASGDSKIKLFHMVVQGRYAPQYWMHLEVVVDAKLKALDSFLRDIWLECCGHLSAFTIEGQSYGSQVDRDSFFGSEDKSMNYKIGSVLRPGLSFVHEYDFGTTTELALKVLSEREGKPINRPIQIMARNEPPIIACDKCGKPAAQVCAQCIWDGKGWLCDKCAKSHKCGEDVLLPVVNSPRVGMCGYTGEAYE
jgi:hypothetical protein